MNETLLSMVQTLCAQFGPSGCEEQVRGMILEAALPYADAIETDPMGNLMVFRKGNQTLEKPVMLCAHMDEVGVIVKKITDEGMIKFGFIGGVDPRVVIGRRIYFRNGAGEEVVGVVGIKAVHLTTASERKTAPKAKDMYIDIGCTTKKQAENKLAPGDCGTFSAAIRMFGDGLMKAKAIDDRLGCAVLLTLLREVPPVDTWFVFTVQEEVGLRGAATAAFRLQPGFCLIVEGTTASDLAEAPAHKQVCALRQGVVLPFMDRGTIYDAELFALLRTACEKRDIPWQTKHMVAGGTDGGRVHKIGEGVRVVGVAAPVRYIHSPVSVAAVSDLENVCRAARAFLEEIGGDQDV